ncbi:hypothetical protein [Paraburkholderia caledonica]|uniref:Uncharacterized protein n=1 Tax=Paraburkholderia caledonica TaxID=134536 RepID=A0AB73IPM6_9BURK|nr:hypothetical protein [Paraburkholderia caledonica]
MLEPIDEANARPSPVVMAAEFEMLSSRRLPQTALCVDNRSQTINELERQIARCWALTDALRAKPASASNRLMLCVIEREKRLLEDQRNRLVARDVEGGSAVPTPSIVSTGRRTYNSEAEMATRFVETARQYYSFSAAEEVVEQKSRTIGSAAGRLHLLYADLAALALGKGREPSHITRQLSSIMVAISASIQVQQAVVELILSPSHHRLRNSKSLVSTPAQFDAFDSAIDRLEKFSLMLDSHLELQQHVIDATVHLIDCLQAKNDMKDL